ETERDAALAVRDHALVDRDAAVTATEQARAERDQALAERDDARRERDTARSTLTQFEAQRAHESSSLGAAMVMRRAVQTPPAFKPAPSIVPRVAAVIFMLLIVVAL